MTIWYDVSDLAHWNLRHLTGIQRVSVGILDGLTGARFCLFISSYELLIDLKVVELEQDAQASP